MKITLIKLFQLSIEYCPDFIGRVLNISLLGFFNIQDASVYSHALPPAPSEG
jgi:hypothetical protein